MINERPKSFMAETAYNLVNEDLEGYKGLLPWHIKKINFFLKFEFSAPNHRIHIDKDKCIISIEILDMDNKPVTAKPKKSVATTFRNFVDIPNYRIIFKGENNDVY